MECFNAEIIATYRAEDVLCPLFVANVLKLLSSIDDRGPPNSQFTILSYTVALSGAFLSLPFSLKEPFPPRAELF